MLITGHAFASMDIKQVYNNNYTIIITIHNNNKYTIKKKYRTLTNKLNNKPTIIIFYFSSTLYI